MDVESVKSRAEKLPGQIGFYYRDLTTGNEYGLNSDTAFTAASIIKIPILAEIFRQFACGDLNKNTLIKIRPEDKVPSCGAISYIHDGAELTLSDICNLMVVISDNSGANILTRTAGFAHINRFMAALGLKSTRINRFLYNRDGARLGKRNTFTPADIGKLFDLMWKGSLVSANASHEMLEIFKLQQIAHKMPEMLPESVVLAHKTGEDTGITHDAGIVYARRPFILCFACENTDVVAAEQFIRETTLDFYRDHIH